jgi:hypothetical protein
MNDINAALDAFLALAQAKVDTQYTDSVLPAPVLTIRRGKRYAKVIRETSVHCFVDLTNGDVLKAASWKAPAKHARGNIFAADGGASGVSAWGGTYLR